MSGERIARVRWHVGQVLLPEHFTAMEEGLTQTAHLYASLSGLPGQGILRLELDPQILARGGLALQRFTAVLPSGTLVDVPGNGHVPPFDASSSGRTRVQVYLHKLVETVHTPPDEACRRLYRSDTDVQRTFQLLRLSTDPLLDGAVECLPLATLEKQVDGVWRLDPSFIPPLLSIAQHPFLEPLREELNTLLVRLRFQLELQLQDNLLGVQQQAGTRRALMATWRVQAMMRDVDAGLTGHPFVLYNALRELMLELYLYHRAVPEAALPAYRHDRLAKTLEEVMGPIRRMTVPSESRAPYQMFSRKDGQLVAEPLPATLEQASQIYLLIQRASTRTEVSLEGVRLASSARLPLVYRLALPGLRFDRVKQPEFAHSFGAEVDFYLIHPDDELKQAIREGSLAFYDMPAMADSNAALFWRME